MSSFIKRNLKIFFRDKSAVFFSLFAVLIIIALYVLFLGNIWESSSMLENVKDSKAIMKGWLAAGIIAVASVTTTLGAFGIMIDDKVKKISKDFHASPVKNQTIAQGYILSSFLIGIIMSVITAVVAEIYIVLKGSQLWTLNQQIEIVLLIILSTMTNTSIICFIVSFFKSHNAFHTASSIIGTLIGFLTGMYVPIGSYPSSIQTVVKLFPVSYSVSLFRQVIMGDRLKTGFTGLPVSYLNGFKEYMGVTYKFGSHEVTTTVSVCILIVTTIVFYGLAVLNMNRKEKN